MRSITTTLVAAALPLTLLAFAPATPDEVGGSVSGSETTTGEPGATVTPDPIDVTYHMHGDAETAYTDDAYYATSTLDGVLTMDRTAPEGDFDSQQLKNYSQGPNASCSGNGLFLTWKGWMGRGTATGEAIFAFDVVGSTGGEVTVEVYADTAGECNEEYIEPVATTDVVIPVGAGRAEAVLDLEGVAPSTSLTVQVRAVSNPRAIDNPVDNPGAPIWTSAVAAQDPTVHARVLYDGADYDATLSFTCQPDDIIYDEDGKPSHAPTCLPF